MKRSLSLVAASLLALLLVGCGEEAPKPAPVVPTTAPADQAVPTPAPVAPAPEAPADNHSAPEG